MRLSSIFSVVCLPLVAMAAKKPVEKTFADFHTKSTPIKLDDPYFDRITKTPRDYSVVVQLTATEARFGCQVCTEFEPEWEVLSKSWRKGDKAGESRLLFATLDFIDGKSTFQSMQLQHAPVLLLYLPTTGPHAKMENNPVRFDFNSGTINAEGIHAWIARHLPHGPTPPVVRPFNYMKLVGVTTAVLGALTAIAVAAPYVLPIIQNRNIWAGISLIAVLLFTSGHMYNHIRKVPYVSGDGKGGISYFAGGFSNQYGLETQIVAGLYGVLAFATINLALKVPRIVDPKGQQLATIVWVGVIFLVYSFLLSVFRFKNGGYPFWLPPF